MLKLQIPWSRIVLDGMVIVGSILLAFAIDTWWEGRGERQLIAQQKDLLHAQMSSNATELWAENQRAQMATQSLGVAVAAIAPGPTSVSPDSLYGMIFPGLLMRDSDLETSASEWLLSSGQLHLATDATLHRQLVSFGGMAGRFARDIERFVSVRERLLDYVYSVGPFPVWSSVVSSGLAGGRPQSVLVVPSFDGAGFEVPVDSLLSDARFRELLAEVWSRHLSRVEVSATLAALADSIVTNLQPDD